MEQLEQKGYFKNQAVGHTIEVVTVRCGRAGDGYNGERQQDALLRRQPHSYSPQDEGLCIE